MMSRVVELMRVGRWDEAHQELQRELLKQPSCAQAHAYQGLCYYRQGRFEEAIAPLRRAIALDEGYWEAGTKLAQALDRLLRFEEALEVAENFLLQRPSDPTLVHLRAGLQRSVPEKLTDSWQKSKQLDWYQVELTHSD